MMPKQPRAGKASRQGPGRVHLAVVGMYDINLMFTKE